MIDIDKGTTENGTTTLGTSSMSRGELLSRIAAIRLKIERAREQPSIDFLKARDGWSAWSDGWDAHSDWSD